MWGARDDGFVTAIFALSPPQILKPRPIITNLRATSQQLSTAYLVERCHRAPVTFPSLFFEWTKTTKYKSRAVVFFFCFVFIVSFRIRGVGHSKRILSRNHPARVRQPGCNGHRAMMAGKLAALARQCSHSSCHGRIARDEFLSFV